MAQVRSQKERKQLIRYYTPPSDLAKYNREAKTPQRGTAFVVRALARHINIIITRDDIRAITGVTTCSQTQILESKQLGHSIIALTLVQTLADESEA